jgi:hypothetical protein
MLHIQQIIYNVQDNYGAEVWNFSGKILWGFWPYSFKITNKKLRNFSHRKVRMEY